MSGAPDISLTLPFPPTANKAWQRVGNRTLISEHGKAYRRGVQGQVLVARRSGALPKAALQGPLTAVLLAFPPDDGGRDIDNLIKATLDAMGAAGVYVDDSQIRDLRIVWQDTVKGGAITVNLFKQAGRA